MEIGMKKYKGSCHCQKVQFEFEAEMGVLVECNCSICSKKGAIHFMVMPDQLKLLSGKENLREYQFNTKTATHFFCEFCGIHPFSHPRVAPEMYDVNIRCLDNFDIHSIELVKFDGKIIHGS